jgi:hypothetical protein
MEGEDDRLVLGEEFNRVGRSQPPCRYFSALVLLSQKVAGHLR